MKKFFLNRAATVLMASLVVVGALIAQPVFALIQGTATSSTNNVTAVGANIQVADGLAPDGSGGIEAYGTAITGSLAAKFTNNTQTIYAGYIDVKNASTTDAFATGYTLANLESLNSGASPDTDLSTALTVEVDVRNVADTCGAGPVAAVANIATATPIGGGAQINIVDSTAWATLSTANRAAINATSAEERVCFYLTITGAPNTVAGGALTYKLTFTAN